MIQKIVALVVFILIIEVAGVEAQIVTYSAPKQIKASEFYTVEVSQQSDVKSSFVYSTSAQTEFNLSKTTSYTNFSFEGKVRIKVTKLNGDFKSCKIYPSSYKIVARTEGRSAIFEFDRPRKVSVEFDNDITNALLIFGDSLETNVPKPTDNNVRYFAPGFYDLDEEISLKPNETLYVAGGAYLKTRIKIENAPNAKVMGRGILDAEKFGHGGKFITISSGSDDVLIEGVTLLNSSGFNVSGRGKNTIVRNLKTIGWWFNTDGIDAGANALVDDCFLKCNDDAIKLYNSGMVVQNTTIWQMENGSPFQITWNMPSDNSGFIVRNCDVIHCDHAWDNPNEGVFSSVHGGSGNMSNYLFDDVRVENCDWRLVSMYILPNQFSKSKTLGTISNINFKNITVTTPELKPMKRVNMISGFDNKATISNITFENLCINGQYIRNAEEGRFEFDSITTSNITFKVTADKINAPIKVEKQTTAQNLKLPITDGINSYGMRDFFLMKENNRWYLTGTEVTNPEWPKKGISLYSSNNLENWIEEAVLINRSAINKDAWYRDMFWSPEIHKYQNRYYLLFSARNQVENPYGPLSVGIAVSDKLKGPYKMITEDKPLLKAQTMSLIDEGSEGVYAVWDDLGIVYTAKIDLEKGKLISEPVEIISAKKVQRANIVDAPSIVKFNKTYYLFYCNMKQNYEVNYATSKQITGPYTVQTTTPLVSLYEFRAETKQKMPYGNLFPFAPPTEQIGHVQLFHVEKNKFYLVYHSSDKYAEPYLCIVPAEIDENGKVKLMATPYNGVEWPYKNKK